MVLGACILGCGRGAAACNGASDVRVGGHGHAKADSANLPFAVAHRALWSRPLRYL